jgi:hypothetical protein
VKIQKKKKDKDENPQLNKQNNQIDKEKKIRSLRNTGVQKIRKKKVEQMS